MILTIWLLMKRKLSVGMSMKIWGWYTFAWHQCTIRQWSIGTRICGASLYNNVTSLRWFDTKFDERDACDDAIGWWMLWVHGSIVTSMTPSFCCRIFLRDDFEAGEKKGWDFKQEMKSLKNRRTFEVVFLFRPVRCASYFRVFFLWARSMEVLLCAPFAGGLCDVWIASFLRFEFDFVSFYLSAFAVSGFFSHDALAGSDISFGEKHDGCDRVGSPMVSGSVVLPLFNFSSSPGFSITSIQSGNRGVFGNTVHKKWIM